VRLALFGTVDRRQDVQVRSDRARDDDDATFGEPSGGLRLVVEQPRVPQVSEEELAAARERSARSGLEMVDLAQVEIDPSAAGALPSTIARRHRAAAIGRRFGLPLIAVSFPENLLALDDIYLAAGGDVLVVVAPERQVDVLVERLYPSEHDAIEQPSAPADQALGAHAEGHYDLGDVDWYRVGGAHVAPWSPPTSGEEVRADPVLPRLEPLVEPPELGQQEQVELGRLGEDPSGDNVLTVPQAGVPFEEDRRDVVADELEGRCSLSDGDQSAEVPLELSVEPAEIAEAETKLEHLDVVSDAATNVVAQAEALAAHVEGDLGSDARSDLGALEALEPLSAAKEPAWTRRDLGEILRARGAISDEQLATARQHSQTTGRPLRTVLAELHLVEEAELLEAVAEEAGRELVDLDHWPIDPRAGALLPEQVARRYGVLAIGFDEGRPVVATSDPSDVVALDDVRSLLGGEVVTVVCSAQQIDIYLGRVYRRSEETDLAARDAALVARDSLPRITVVDDANLLSDEAPVVKFVNLVLRQALNEKASDVHIEPGAHELVVRCRIDGVLQHLTSAPKAIQGSVTTRLKVMAGLDIAEHRIPQDGRFSLGAGNRQVDLRLATLPTVHGEKIVLRILDKTTAPLELGRLGFLPGVLERYERAYRKPAGTILVTGPTGSGKSTTLYATLAELNSPERNLITVEDPVEYQLPGVNQVQVNPKAGLTFANALRSILRADPDIILVGEIRDRETATIAVEAALTGHLVLSCLHTNDAAGTPMRLIEMGVEPFLVGSAIDCVLAQRLARILCQRCAQPYEPNAEELRAAGWDDEVLDKGEAPAFRRAVGCQACSGTGYRGRIAIQEVLLVDEAIERAILDRAQSEEIARLASEQGMRTLRVDGLHKAALGITSLEEIMRVVA
jgi:type IV pilus assembly protein PilB